MNWSVIYKEDMRNILSISSITRNMDYKTILLWLSFLWASLRFYNSARRRRKLPPGPFTLPIVGSLFKLGNKPHESLAILAQTYGSLMTLKLGSLTTVVASSSSMAKEILQKHDQAFASRTVPDAVRVLDYPSASLVWLPYSLQWRNLRKLCASYMFAVQRLNDSEQIRLSKVNDLIDYIKDKSNSKTAINVGQVVFCTTLNMISNTLFSVDFAHLNSGPHDFKNYVWGVLEEGGRPNLADYFPLLRFFDPQGARKRTASYFEKLDSIFDEIIDGRLQCKEQNASDDLLNTILFHSQENGFQLNRLDIKSLIKDLFIAGTDTSSGTLEWAMTELLRNHEILRKARLELKENIAEDVPIKESDIARLPYLQAIVKETLRLHPPAPLLIPHSADVDVDIGCFRVPKHTQVLVNAWAISRDPGLWCDPTLFMPDRFVGSTVDFRGRDFEFIPFGAGRRICPGLSLAYRKVHLILASLLHSFNWKLEDGMKPEDINMEEKVGITLQKAKPLYAVPVKD